jgi:hypothetical protein
MNKSILQTAMQQTGRNDDKEQHKAGWPPPHRVGGMMAMWAGERAIQQTSKIPAEGNA